VEEEREVLQRIERLEKERQFVKALETAQNALKRYKNSRPLAIALARLFYICKQYPQSFNLFKALYEQARAEGRQEAEFPVIFGLANSLLKLGKVDEAERILENLKERNPEQVEVYVSLASCKRQKGRLLEAEEMLKEVLKKEPDHKEARYELAQVYMADNELERAVELLEKNIKRKDPHGDSIDLWLAALQKMHRFRYSQDTLEELSQKYPETLEFIYGFAVLSQQAGEHRRAREAYLQALKLAPENPRILYELGVLERILGNLEDSQRYMEKALEINPENATALATHGRDIKYTYGDKNWRRLHFAAARLTDLPPFEQVSMHYALAKAFEDVGELDTAFRHYEIAGMKKRRMESYNEQEHLRLVETIKKVITPENLAKAKERGCESEIPVFVLGMPRSGTSLMEQILASHPEVYGAGELKYLVQVLENIGIGENKQMRLRLGVPDPVFPYELNASWEMRGQRYVDRLIKLAGKPYKRIVDKMPGNFHYIGLIKAILPKARVIHMRRHPMEVCLSCYRIHFAEGQQWSYNLSELGRFYRRYWDLMNYWREAFQGCIYEVRYEELVMDTENQVKKVLEYVGLPFHENCLNFYQTERPVQTASLSQVRKPIYTSSLYRWRKYEKYLEPLYEEIRDLVEEYEKEVAPILEKLQSKESS